MIDKSSRKEALSLIEQALEEIYDEKVPVSRQLMRCQRIAILLNSQELNQWIWWELEGYPHPDYNEEHKDKIPNHRRHNLWAEPTGASAGQLGKLLEIASKTSNCRCPFPTVTPCRTLERAQGKIEVYTKLRYSRSLFEKEEFRRIQKPRTGELEVRLHAFLDYEDMQSTLSGIRSSVHQFLISQRNALLFESATQGLVDSSMNLIASRLQNLDSDLLSGIVGMVKTQVGTDSAIDWNSVSNTCRTVTQRFTELIYLDDMTPDGETRPPHDKTRSKCRNITKWSLTKIGIKKEDMPEASRIEGIPDFLDNYYYTFIRSVQKVKHKDTYKLKKDEVDRVALYLILWLADVIRLLDHAEYNWSRIENSG